MTKTTNLHLTEDMWAQLSCSFHSRRYCDERRRRDRLKPQQHTLYVWTEPHIHNGCGCLLCVCINVFTICLSAALPAIFSADRMHSINCPIWNIVFLFIYVFLFHLLKWPSWLLMERLCSVSWEIMLWSKSIKPVHIAWHK